MRLTFFLIFTLQLLTIFHTAGQITGNDSFTWGNVTYKNMLTGEIFNFNGKDIELLQIKNHYNKIRIGNDTVWRKVDRRSPASDYIGFRLFVADNRSVKNLSPLDKSHGLLTGDALIALVKGSSPLLDPDHFSFPVDFTDGFTWHGDEESYMFSYIGGGRYHLYDPYENKGVGINIPNTRPSRKNMIIALENGTVAWIETGQCGMPRAAVCIKSESSPGIFCIYENLYDKHVLVKKNQKILRGEGIGYIWGEGEWENLRLNIVRSDTIPGYSDRYANSVNFYPQLLELYFGKNLLVHRVFSRGQIDFGKAGGNPGIARNTSAFEEYDGTGWLLGDWNPADKTEWVSDRNSANARLRVVLFEGEPAQCTNPGLYFTYEINVRDGLYRIRANVGDCLQASWQKVEFEGVSSGIFQLMPGEFAWTPEKIVRVYDGRLTVRITLADKSGIAGISRIVFQQAE